MIGKWFLPLPFIFANKNYTLTTKIPVLFSASNIMILSFQRIIMILMFIFFMVYFPKICYNIKAKYGYFP